MSEEKRYQSIQMAEEEGPLPVTDSEAPNDGEFEANVFGLPSQASKNDIQEPKGEQIELSDIAIPYNDVS